MADATQPERTTYENVKQGVNQVYPKEDDVELNKKTNLDIVFVPGLGARPLESWQSEKTKWNWIDDKQGLAKDYPAARIFLYSHESAFHGSLKVEQFLDNLAIGLLDSLQVRREHTFKRPIVFIGHSMGGLIIAKAITLMDSRRDSYTEMLEATAGCIFFGSPFLGAESASMAAMMSVVGEKFGLATTSKLLDLMKPGDESLRDLRGEFLRLVSKTSPKIEVHCFWEEQNTDVAKMGVDFMKKHVGDTVATSFYALFKKAKEPFKIVSRESASFENAVTNSGLACNHRDLVKFDDSKDGRFQVMRGPLKRILHAAPSIAKNRLNSAPNIDYEGMKNITKALGGGVSIQARRKALEQKFALSSWLAKEVEFKEWLASEDLLNSQESDQKRGDCLWICGAEGRGKTGALLAGLRQIEGAIKESKKVETGKAAVLLVYCFCDPTEYSTAEELLKTIVWQLTQEQPAFTSYAKQFTERPGRQPVSLSIENLWQSLQDMFSDLTASSRIYIVINNLHSLSDESDSTRKLMELIKGDIEAMQNEEISRTSVHWLFSSRKAKPNIEANLRTDTVRVIDLEDEKYVDQVQLDLRRHAQKKVAKLGTEKGYKKDLAYFVTSLIGNRAQNTGWIDIAVDQLEDLPDMESSLRVRQVLKTLPQKLDDLLDGAWQQIFDANPRQADVIREVLRALVLTYEEPSLTELAVLTDFKTDEEGQGELRKIIELCSSFLVIKDTETSEATVCFKNDIAKPHLLSHADKLLGLSKEEKRWQHGELALRCFDHIVEKFTIPEKTEQANAEESAEKSEDQVQKGEDVETNAGDQESDAGSTDSSDDDVSEPETEPKAFPYMVKHWLHHASKATSDMADDLSKEENFWCANSPIRRHWLAQYAELLNIHFPTQNWTALHVAAAIGYRKLLSALIDNGYEGELTKYEEDWSNAPIHLAAAFGRPNITEELIYRGSPVDAVLEEGDETPLAMAAFKGNIKVMKLLLDANADINARDKQLGPLLNQAILSGNLEAVKLLVDKDANISDEEFSPLRFAAALPDRTVYNYLMEAGRNHLQDHDYDSALITAAYAGNTEIFKELLEYEHDKDTYQKALDEATGEAEWPIVRLTMEKCEGLDCNNLFKVVATVKEDLDSLLEAVWDYADGSISQEALNDALYEATDREKNSTVKTLLDLKADPNSTGAEFGNALTAAAYDGNTKLVKLLLDAGADPNAETGWALQTAAGEGHLEVVQLLLENEAEINACTDDERFPPGTALQAAVESGKSDVVDFLLEYEGTQVDLDLGAGDLMCPLNAAAWKGEGDILLKLLEAGAKVNRDSNNSSSTPLIGAAAMLPVKHIKALLDADVEVNHADVDGDTALIVAASFDDWESVVCLLRYGADLRISAKTRGNALQVAAEKEKWKCVEILINHASRLLVGDESADYLEEKYNKLFKELETEKENGDEEDKDKDGESDEEGESENGENDEEGESEDGENQQTEGSEEEEE